MTVKDLIDELKKYDDNLEVMMPIWKSQGIIIDMEVTDGVYTNISEDNKTITSVFIM
jgi:hypothetical protein